MNPPRATLRFLPPKVDIIEKSKIDPEDLGVTSFERGDDSKTSCHHRISQKFLEKKFQDTDIMRIPRGTSRNVPLYWKNITEYDEIGPKVTRLRTKLESFSPGTSRIICDDTKLQWKIPQLPIITDYFWRASKKSFKFKPYWR